MTKSDILTRLDKVIDELDKVVDDSEEILSQVEWEKLYIARSRLVVTFYKLKRPKLHIRGDSKHKLSVKQATIINKPISELDLSVRPRKCMNRLGIKTLGELSQKTADELLKMNNFGQVALREIEDVLRQYGLSLHK